MATWACSPLFADATERLEWEGRRLAARNLEWTSLKPRKRASQDMLAKADRGFSFIFIAAVLEDLFRSLNSDLIDDLRRLVVPRHALRLSSLSLLDSGVWSDVNSDRVLRVTRRRDVVTYIGNFYNADQPSLDFEDMKALGVHDGRTIKPENFEALWEGLSLGAPGDSVWPSLRHRTAVKTIADKRNLIAHFEADPRVEAFRFNYADLKQRCDDVLETVQRLEAALVIWLDRHESPPSALIAHATPVAAS